MMLFNLSISLIASAAALQLSGPDLHRRDSGCRQPAQDGVGFGIAAVDGDDRGRRIGDLGAVGPGAGGEDDGEEQGDDRFYAALQSGSAWEIFRCALITDSQALPISIHAAHCGQND